MKWIDAVRASTTPARASGIASRRQEAHRQPARPRHSIFWMALFSVVVAAALAGCKKPVNENDLPVSHWADPETIGTVYGGSCSVASAQAILKAGLPFPNYGTRDELAPDGKT